MSDELRLFALSESRALAAAVAAALDRPLAAHEERDFEDGEHKTRPLENVRGRDVFVIQSLHGDATRSVNDKLCRLLFFLGALRDAGAERLTAVLPYLCYARKDRRTQPRDPLTTRYVAQLIEAMGVNRVVGVEVHNLAAFQNAYRCRTDHLDAVPLFVRHCAALARGRPVAVVSPDVGGIKRAEGLRLALERQLAVPVTGVFMEKWRSGGMVSGTAVVGEVTSAVAIVYDDLISTGGTVARAAAACRERGAHRVYAAATHGVFSADADRILAQAPLDGIVITNTVAGPYLGAQFSPDKLTVLDIAPLLAEAIGRIHAGGSLVELLKDRGLKD